MAVTRKTDVRGHRSPSLLVVARVGLDVVSHGDDEALVVPCIHDACVAELVDRLDWIVPALRLTSRLMPLRRGERRSLFAAAPASEILVRE
jgi:hypothetical protein